MTWIFESANRFQTLYLIRSSPFYLQILLALPYSLKTRTFLMLTILYPTFAIMNHCLLHLYLWLADWVQLENVPQLHWKQIRNKYIVSRIDIVKLCKLCVIKVNHMLVMVTRKSFFCFESLFPFLSTRRSNNFKLIYSLFLVENVK